MWARWTKRPGNHGDSPEVVKSKGSRNHCNGSPAGCGWDDCLSVFNIHGRQESKMIHRDCLYQAAEKEEQKSCLSCWWHTAITLDYRQNRRGSNISQRKLCCSSGKQSTKFVTCDFAIEVCGWGSVVVCGCMWGPWFDPWCTGISLIVGAEIWCPWLVACGKPSFFLYTALQFIRKVLLKSEMVWNLCLILTALIQKKLLWKK